MKVKGIIHFVAICVLSFATSCAREVQIDEHKGDTSLPTVPSGMVRLEIFANNEDYQQPNTRNNQAQEELVDTKPWVFVFRGSEDNATFVEMGQAEVINGKSYVALTKTSSPSRLLIIANTPVNLDNGSGMGTTPFTRAGLAPKLVVNMTTFADVANTILQSTHLDHPQQTSVPYADANNPMPLPMASDYALEVIDENTTIGTSARNLILKRMLAKVTVSNEAEEFVLYGAGAVNVPRNGRFFQIAAGTLKDNSGTLTDYLSSGGNTLAGIADAATGGNNNTNANPLYIYESRKEDHASIIIKGKYNNADYFYRLAFINAKSTETTNSEEIDVLRNKYYEFKITSVTGKGYTTIGEAKSAQPSNFIDYRIVVSDQLSHDIIDNGQYYLGVSNSECIVYDKNHDVNSLIVFTLSTNAPASINTSIVPTGVGLSLTDPSQVLSIGGSPSVTDIRVNMASSFTRGIITVTVGNLSKVVTISRVPRLAYAGVSECFADGYVSGEVTSGSWLSLSSTNDASTGVSKITETNGGIYLFASENVSQSDAILRSGGEVYLSRTDQSGRVKLLVTQGAMNTGNIVPNISGFHSYVGTFHRWNQKGERVIRIKNVLGGSPIVGRWVAKVLRGEDFIILDKEGINRSLPYTDDAESHQVTGNASAVSGIVGQYIYFRVGLKNRLSAATSKPRYGLILVYFTTESDGNTVEYNNLIYVRQGEEPDYLMDYNTKWATFNLKSSDSFVEYPTQPGGYFQWGRSVAYNAVDPMGSAWNSVLHNSIESSPCPAGYRYPTAGSAASGAEMPKAFLENSRNSLWGYCADGYYDRNKITKPFNNTGYDCAVNAHSNGVGYIGRVFYNSANLASLFVPSSGYRFDKENGKMSSNISSYGYIWSSTISTAEKGCYTFFNDDMVNGVYPSSGGSDRRNACPVRCVKDESTHRLMYNANGGVGVPSPEEGMAGAKTVVSSIVPTRRGYEFGRWNTKNDGSGISYKPGEIFTFTGEDITLFAIWIRVETIYPSYVGIFYRYYQTGERIISMSSVISSTIMTGEWSATVVSGNFIKLDTNLLGRTLPFLGNAMTAEGYQVAGNSQTVSGVCSFSSPIYFRVGLSSRLESETCKPRYGLIRLLYNRGTAVQYIYVRQGEAADYVMNPSDAISSGDMNSSTRPLARKFSAFNLTDPHGSSGLVDWGTFGYSFTDYPTKAGYLFQFYQTRSWDPNNTSLISDPNNKGPWGANLIWESCPSGYHRPNNGNTMATTLADPSVRNSEIKQSLYLNPQMGNAMSNTDNFCWGYYADGYFDRQAIGSSSSSVPYSRVGIGADIAYIGGLFYNPTTYQHVFFPASGYKISGRKPVQNSGRRADIWTSTASITSGGGWDLQMCPNPLALLASSFRKEAKPIRCVKN